jgi:hypothetical protein
MHMTVLFWNCHNCLDVFRLSWHNHNSFCSPQKRGCRKSHFVRKCSYEGISTWILHTYNKTTKLRNLGLHIDGLWERGSIPDRKKVLFPFSALFRPVVGPTHTPIQSIQWAFSPGTKRQEREADQSPPSSAKVENGRAISPFATHLHGAMANYIYEELMTG